MKPIINKNLIRKFTIDRRIRVGYGTAFFLLLISYLLTLYVNRDLLKQAKLVEHTNKVIVHLEMILSSEKDAENALRGYIITKDENFLDPYRKGAPVLDSVFKIIRKETIDNPATQQNLDTLQYLIRKQNNIIVFDLAHYSRQHFTITDSLKSMAYSGKQTMDRIRVLISSMQQKEQALSQQRSVDMHHRYDTLNSIVIVSLILAFLVVIYGFFTYSRENIARRRADQTVFEYQEQLKQQIQELDRANKELVQMRSIEKLAATGRIARTIAHEVRNPLTNINLSVDQLRLDMNEDHENAQIMLDMISRNSHRINQLITDLLNSTKSSTLFYQKMSVNHLLEETLKLAQDRITLNNIRVEKEYSEDICDISVDIEKIKIAFLNIIVNAIEAMESDKGVLRIKTEGRNGKCVVTISDNGCGIDKESLSKLFEPYFTSKPKGTGLGLTNTHNIIVNHNGYIHADSQPGKGTSFTIILNFA